MGLRGASLWLSLACIVPGCAEAQPQQAAAPVPAPSADSLPPVRDLMLEVERNQRRFEAAQRDYTYHVRIEEQDFDSHGGVKKTVITDAESLSLDGVRVDKVVAKNGKPLTPEEAGKESERIDKEVAKARERQSREEAKGRETDGQGHEVVSVSRILELGTFSNPRRDTLNGRPVLVLDYNGDPHASTHNQLEGMMKDLTGQVWIDERDRVLVQGHGEFVNDFKIGGGLVADVHKGLHFDFRSTKINDEVWLPQHLEAQGSARILLFARVDGRLTVATSDYRKFRTTTTILPSAADAGTAGQSATDPAAQPAAEPPAADRAGQAKTTPAPPR